MLYIIGTPIGNLSDLSKRAVETLSSVDIVFAEDTRTALNLLNSQGIKKPCKSYYKDNEKTAAENIIECLLNGDNAALISEAGMPCISDPGAVVIKEVIKKGLPFEIIQGPTALIHGLIASGFSGSSFYFHGFLPHKEKDKIKLEQKIENKNKAANELNRRKNVVMTALNNQSKNTIFTNKEYKEAINKQIENKRNIWNNYKKGIR